jgi:hypothetical protein
MNAYIAKIPAETRLEKVPFRFRESGAAAPHGFDIRGRFIGFFFQGIVRAADFHFASNEHVSAKNISVHEHRASVLGW